MLNVLWLQIYILLFKELSLALKINSDYSKRKLLSIHENVRVLRYPDHFSTGVYLWYALLGELSTHWHLTCNFLSLQHIGSFQTLICISYTYRSHHEKLVIVDYQICFIGGLDLCFGRYDTFEHKVGDNPPLVWPGKDYYNPK